MKVAHFILQQTDDRNLRAMSVRISLRHVTTLEKPNYKKENCYDRSTDPRETAITAKKLKDIKFGPITYSILIYY